MTEEIEVYHQDMESYLKPEEYQAFLKAKEKIEEYNQKRVEHEKKKADAEQLTAQYLKKRAEAKSDVERSTWDAKAMVSRMEALMPAPYEPTHYFREHDHYIDLVRERKLKQLEEEKRRKAEEEAERQREEERKKREQQMMHAAMRRKMLADSEWEVFKKTLNSTIKNLRHQLANPKPFKIDPGCSPEVFKYCPQSWCDLELPSNDEVEAWAKPQILEKIPEVLQPLVTWDLTPQTLVVPKVEYNLVGVPCLVWHFDIYVAAKVDLWLKESTITKEFHGWKYIAPIKAEKIGYFFLKAQFWGSREGFTTPISLLRLMVEDKLEAPGIEIEVTYTGASIYTVTGFEEHRLEHYYIDVREEFRQFIKGITENQSLGQGLLAWGLTDEVTANLVEVKWNQPLPVSGDLGDAGGSDLESVIAKLVELGKTEAEAKEAVETTTFPNNATSEEIVSIILQKSY